MTGFLAPASQKAIRSKCLRTSQSFVTFKAEETELSIPVRFERTVCKYRDRAAVTTSNGTVSYEELNKTANRTTRVILAHSALQGRSEQPIVAETEMALLAFSGIKEAVVVVREDQRDDQQLGGYLVAAGHPHCPSAHCAVTAAPCGDNDSRRLDTHVQRGGVAVRRLRHH